MKKLSQETIDKILEAAEKAREKGIKVRLDLNHCDLSGLDLKGANLGYANLEDANLGCVNLRSANLECANLRSANLWYAILEEADLSWTNLEGAILKGADLSWTNLSGANLERTNLQGADFWCANLRGANLDFSVFNLSCHSRNIKADDRLINQLLWHVANIMKSSGREVPQAIKKLANQSHLIAEYELEKL